MQHRIFGSSLAVALALFSNQPLALAQAVDQGEVTSTMTITRFCELLGSKTSTVNFGSVPQANATGAPEQSPGTLNVRCGNGTSYSLTAEEGDYFAQGTRHMKRVDAPPSSSCTVANNNDCIPYRLFRTAARADASSWDLGTVVGFTPISAAANNIRSHAFFGRYNLRFHNLPGTYTDLVTVTLSF